MSSEARAGAPRGESAAGEEPARILVVDDRPANLMSIVEILRPEGWLIMTAASGKEALRILIDHDFSVILLDVNMPGMDGFDVAKMIRERPRSANTPIIFVTAFRMEDTSVSRGYSLGAVDYIFSPIVPVILRAKVSVFVELDQKARHLRLLLREREASEARYRALFHGTPVPLWELSLATVKEMVDRLRGRAADAIERRLGETPGLIAELASHIELREMNQATLEMCAAEGDAQLRGALGKVFGLLTAPSVIAGLVALERGQRTIEGEATLATLDGHEKHVAYRLSLLPGYEASWSRVVVSTTDIAELHRQRAELERSNRELQQFAYVASHDLRAPLRAIDALSGWLESDLHQVLHDEQREQMDLLRGRVRRMDRLLSDLLEYARAGGEEVKVEQVSWADLVREVAELNNLSGRFTIEIVPPAPTFDTAAVPLRRVLLNLIANAIKHHDRQEGTIRVTAREEGALYYFSVADDGPGIPPAFHERVFRMFQTLRPRDAVEGSGMGLALVKKLVESAGGTITIESGSGRGARFVFSWPKVWGDRRARPRVPTPLLERA